VNTSQDTSLDGGAGGDDLGLAGVAGLQVSEELDMIGIGVVGSKPSFAGNCLGLVYMTNSVRRPTNRRKRSSALPPQEQHQHPR
jgi:hypothetical protein